MAEPASFSARSAADVRVLGTAQTTHRTVATGVPSSPIAVGDDGTHRGRPVVVHARVVGIRASRCGGFATRMVPSLVVTCMCKQYERVKIQREIRKFDGKCDTVQRATAHEEHDAIATDDRGSTAKKFRDVETRGKTAKSPRVVGKPRRWFD
jgi:hypothetical protein